MVPESSSSQKTRFGFFTRFPWQVVIAIIVLIQVVIWMIYAPDGILGKADAIGYAVCHRISHRSFAIGDHQFSVCARCTGQYLGAVLGMIFLTLTRRSRSGRPPWAIIGILVAFLVAYGIDGVNSALHLFPQGLFPWLDKFMLYTPNNILRLITGMGVGLGISVMLFPAFNQTVWRRYNFQPVLEGARDFGLLLFFAAIVVSLVLTQNPIILYPLSLISAGGVLMLLTMVYTMVWIMLFKRENQFENMRQLFFPLIAGFAVALAQILVLDGIRFWLTGTWGGFPLG